ncbi:glycosyltransferase family 9 protein [Nodosilinea sp. PGN35]|uniref:glycosyltransferase family 9 protein n=1 Tax=Nodosilinea sp. PGN35 TaxID=3020489 RepID=UPI0023B22E65|nr:hypothetical protein [Nodosilinea sp. TSF1-S3]MDF0364944.1 hypothetical protein [Nodosilinea sp. TSF1-S3]
MAVKTSADLQRVLVFTQAQTPALAELQGLCPQADLTVVDPARAAWLLLSQTSTPVDWQRAIAWLRHQQFDAAVILTAPGQSPYTLGYLCYLAGIPIRIGQSHEFGGQVLSHCSPPPEDGDCRHLLDLLGKWWSGWVDKSQPKAL